MIYYKYLNVNPKGVDTNDCVIRAIAICNYYGLSNKRPYYKSDMDNEYYETYKDLYKYGVLNSLMINDERNYMEYLVENRGLKEIKFDKNTIKLKELDKYGFEDMDMVVNLNGHLTVIIDNTLLDTFDCRNEFVESIFVYE